MPEQTEYPSLPLPFHKLKNNTMANLQSNSNDSTLPINTTSSFDFATLRLPTNYGEALGVKKMILRVPVRKPNKAEFFRVHPDPAFRFPGLILEMKEDSETFLLTPEMGNALPGLSRPVQIHTAIDRLGNVFLVPVPLPNEEGIRNPWHESLAQAVATAESQWIRIVANKSLGGYDMLVAQALLPEPTWPDMSLEELLKIAFRDRIINAPDHPVVQKLLGAA